MSLGGDENIPVKTENSPTVHLKVDLDGVSPFTGRSTENGVPVCLPLKNLEELFAWQANDATDHGQPFTVSSLPRREKVNDDSAKVLLCHDMSGNYLDDRFAQQIVGKRTLEYQLSYWSLVDTFVYFSHHFITIPPVGWINACHTNGVLTLGTFITEFTDGYHR
uniref:Cytosolic endo-beta-N-acetylglucosaminidase TIM barrel domain-containing protein n=1 Tax=Ciona savignyi TaxID=51511 RepID=H2YKH1_CIOSA